MCLSFHHYRVTSRFSGEGLEFDRCLSYHLPIDKFSALITFFQAKLFCNCTLQATADYVSRERNVVFQNLRDTAVKSECCGQSSVVEKKLLPAPAPTAKRESMTYAIVTNIIEYTALPISNWLSKVNPKGKRGSRKVKLFGDGNVVKKHEEVISAETPLKKVRAY